MGSVIEKGIPIPNRGGNSIGRKTADPWKEMDIGDSFLVKGRTSGSVSQSRIYMQKQTGRKFITRSEDGGIRVWRIA